MRQLQTRDRTVNFVFPNHESPARKGVEKRHREAQTSAVRDFGAKGVKSRSLASHELPNRDNPARGRDRTVDLLHAPGLPLCRAYPNSPLDGPAFLEEARVGRID